EVPLAPLTAVAASFCRLGPRTVTVAPGRTAPLASWMVPPMEPVICAAASRATSASIANVAPAAKLLAPFMLPSPVPPWPRLYHERRNPFDAIRWRHHR